MATSVIRWKLKNARGFNVVQFEGPHLTYEQLKREISTKILGRNAESDLRIYSADTGDGALSCRGRCFALAAFFSPALRFD